MNWITWALLSATFAAATAIFSKTGLRGIHPDAAQFVRTAVTLAVIAAVVITSGQWRGVGQFSGRTWIWLAIAGFATAASWICYYRALSVGDASRVAVVDKLSVAMIAVVATAGLGERLTPLG
jgi:bacterial/archaeal transporter family protein